MQHIFPTQVILLCASCTPTHSLHRFYRLSFLLIFNRQHWTPASPLPCTPFSSNTHAAATLQRFKLSVHQCSIRFSIFTCHTRPSSATSHNTYCDWLYLHNDSSHLTSRHLLNLKRYKPSPAQTTTKFHHINSSITHSFIASSPNRQPCPWGRFALTLQTRWQHSRGQAS